MIDVKVEPTKPQGSTLGEGEEAKPCDCEEELDAVRRAARDSLSELAKLAANKGQKRTGETASVFEGSGKIDESRAEEDASTSASRPMGAPVVGGVRVMPEANEELQKILASRLRKTS
ncbi:hypothetical protein Esti_001955 [Eimeria stiedai]